MAGSLQGVEPACSVDEVSQGSTLPSVVMEFQEQIRFKAELLIYSPHLPSRQVIDIYAFLSHVFKL